MKAKQTESVKVSTHTLNKVRRQVKKTKQSIGGFIELAIEEKIKKDKPEFTLISDKMCKEDVISEPQKAFIKSIK